MSRTTVTLDCSNPEEAVVKLAEFIGARNYIVQEVNVRGHLCIHLCFQGWVGKVRLEAGHRRRSDVVGVLQREAVRGIFEGGKRMKIDKIRALSLEYAKGNAPAPKVGECPLPEKTAILFGRRSSRYVEVYGIALRHYRKILKAQDHMCAICGAKANLHGDIIGTTKKLLVIDHCHATGRVRGLLCNACNSGLGFFRDDAARLTRAIEYLNRDGVERVQLPKLPHRLRKKYGNTDKLAVFEEAKAWASERYGINEWARTPFGSWMDAGFVKARLKDLKGRMKVAI